MTIATISEDFFGGIALCAGLGFRESQKAAKSPD